MDFDTEFTPAPRQPKQTPGGGAEPAPTKGECGRRVVVLTFVSAAMFASGYAAGHYGFSFNNLRSMFGPKAVAAANPTTPADAAPSAPVAEAPAPGTVTVTPAKESHVSAVALAPIEHAAKPVPVRKAAAAPASTTANPPLPNPTVAAKNAAANARPATATKPPAARFQPSTAKLSVLTNTLQNTRSQLELYNLQHRDQYPKLAQLQKDWSVLAKPTDIDGKVMLAAGRSTLGPYVKQPPVNPITNSAKVAAPGKASADTGWTYDEQTGLLKAVLPGYVIAPELDTESVERVGG